MLNEKPQSYKAQRPEKTEPPEGRIATMSSRKHSISLGFLVQGNPLRFWNFVAVKGMGKIFTWILHMSPVRKEKDKKGKR
jgi:hypothetical protein